MTVRAEWLAVGGEVEPWTSIGLTVIDGAVPLFGTGVRIDPTLPQGIGRWELSGIDDAVVDIDGLATAGVAPATPTLVEHPVGAVGLDHVVVVTDSLERTSAALEMATGAPLRRIREAGEMRQGFHRIGGGLIVEIVERAGLATGPAWFWGLVINVEDLDAAAAHMGTRAITEPRPAVQPGRSIATIREEAGLGLPVALMSMG